MALIPSAEPGKILRWKADGTLENVTMAQVLADLMSRTGPIPGQSLYLDSSSLPLTAAAPAVQAGAAVGPVLVRGGAAFGIAAIQAGASVGAVSAGPGSSAGSASADAVQAGASVGSVSVTGACVVGAPAVQSGASLGGVTVTGTGSAASVSDLFNRAANSSLETGWGAQSGVTGRWGVSALQNASVNGEAADRRTDTFANNQRAEAKVVTVPGFAAKGCGVYVRGSASAKTFYAALGDFADDGEGFYTSYVTLQKCVTGAWTELGRWQRAAGGSDWTALGPLIVRVTANGSSLTVETSDTHGGTYTSRITATDAAIASGSPGLYNEQGAAVVDDFYAEDV